MRTVNWSQIILLLVWMGSTSAAHADALDRVQPQKLRAVHEAIDALKSQRHAVSLSSGYRDVRVLLHVHSRLSHDSRGTIGEIVAAAKKTGVRVIMFSEHPSTRNNYFLDGHRGFKDGVLLIPGAETSGFLAYPRRNIQDQKTDSPQDFANLVRSTGGLVFLSHLEERMDWNIANLTGTEIYNTHADFKNEDRFLAALRSPLMMLTLASLVKQYPQEVFGALMDYPADYLKRYDELCQLSRLTGVAANDAHHNQAYRAKLLDNGQIELQDALGEQVAKLDPGKLPAIKLLTAGRKPGDVIFELDLDSYARSFRHVSTHLLLTKVNEAEVWQALEAGRAYVAFDWLADPTGFVYRAESSVQSWPIGSELPLADGLRLHAEAPLSGRFKLIRNGKVIAHKSGTEIAISVKESGVYRIEVWLNLAGEDRPWILTNPIYVREKS